MYMWCEGCEESVSAIWEGSGGRVKAVEEV